MADPYVYPGTNVLRNLAGIEDAELLRDVERASTAQRMEEPPPDVPISYDGYKALHRHLFEELYEWAGEPRTVNLFKGDTPFAPAARVDAAMAQRFAAIGREGFLRELAPATFAARAAEHVCEINVIHPFREGNGRTLRAFLEVLARQAGHAIDPARIEAAPWHEASVAGVARDYRPMTAVIGAALVADPRAFERWAGIGAASIGQADADRAQDYQPASPEIER